MTQAARSQPRQGLRLVDLTKDRDSYLIERRRAPRRRASGTVTAIIITEESNQTTLGQIAPIQLRDVSETGLGGFSTGCLPEESVVRLFFPPSDYEPGFEATGRVVRCNATADGWSIGVALLKQRTAA